MAVDIETIGVGFDTSGLLKGQAALKQTEGAANRTADAADKTGRSFKALDAAADAAASTMKTLAGVFAVRELAQAVDTYTKFTAQLKLATTSAQDYARAYADVRSISKLAQADLSAVGTLYARIANGTRELGLGQQKLAAITETVSLALKVSGATGAEAASAMLQLAQAFGSGVLRGEEFNAVNEAAPRLMRALADGIGVGVGALRGMAEQGQLTSQVLAEALPKALGELREEAKSVQTIAGSVQLLKNNWLEFVGTQAQASGAVGAVSQSIALLANNLDLLTAAALGYGATRLSQLLFDVGAATGRAVSSTMEYAASQQAQRASAIAAAQAEAQKTAATLANLQATQAGIVAAREQYIAELQLINAFKARGLAMQQASAVTAELALLGQQQARVSAQIAATQAAQTAAQTALNTAMTAGGAAAGLASRALGLLGGPIGAITTLLGLGATAWMLWGSSSKSAEGQAVEAVERSTADIISDLDKQIAKLRERNALVRAGLGGVAGDQSEAAQRLGQLQVQINDLTSGKGPAGLSDAARQGMLQTLLTQYAALHEGIKQVKAEQKNLAATDESLVEVRQRLLGVNKQYLADLTNLQQALSNGAISEAEYVKIVSDLAQKTYAASAAGKEAANSSRGAGKAASDLRRELDAQADILAKLSGVNTDYMEQLSRLNGMWQSGRITQAQYVQLVEELIKKQPGAAKAIEDTARAREQDATIALRQIAAYEALEQAADSQVKYAADMLASIEAETLALTMTNAQREEAIALRQLELQGIKAGTPVYEAYAEKIRQAIADKGMVQATVDATKKAQEEWQRTSDQIGQSLSDALMEGGKSAWEYIKGLFRSQVLAPIIKAVIAPVTGGLSSLITGGAQAATGASGGLGGGTGLFGGLTSFSGWGTGIAGSLGNLGAGFGIGASGGLFGGGLSTGISLMQSGATMGGLGAIAGAVMPWISAIGAIASLFGNRNKWSGQFGETLVSGGMAGDTASRSTFTNSTYSAEVARATQAVGEGIAGAIAAFGGAQQDFVLRQFSATASKKDRAQAGTDLFIGGEFVSIGNVEVKKAEQGQAFADQALRATVVALQKTVEGRFGEYFDSVDALKADIPDLQALLDTATAVQQLGKQLQWLGGPFDDLNNLSVQATSELAKAAGGYDQLLSSASAAYQILFSEQERAAELNRDVAQAFADLNVAVPDSRESFIALLESIDESTASGAKLEAQLLALVPAWDQVKNAATPGATAARGGTPGGFAGDAASVARAYGRTQMQQTKALVEAAGGEFYQAGWDRRMANDGAPASVQFQRSHLDSYARQFAAARGINPNGDLSQLTAQLRATFGMKGGYDPFGTNFLKQEEYAKQAERRTRAGMSAESLLQSWQEASAKQFDLLQQQSSEIMASIEAYRSLNDSLRDFKNSLQLGSMSTLTPQQQYELARAEFERVSGMAAAGDTTAQGMLQGVISTFLEESRSYFGANDAYVADMDRSVGIIDQVVAQRESLEEKSVKLLESVDKKLADLIDVTTRNGSVQEAGFVESVKATRDAVEKQLQASKTERAANA